MKKERTVDFHIKGVWHAISRMYNINAAEAEMTMSMGYVLLNVDAENGTPATKIAPAIGMESRSLTRMLKTLEDKGWIYRKSDAKDKRFVKIFLTEEGREKRNFARHGVIAFNNVINGHIPEEKLNVFFDVISQIKDLVEKITLAEKAVLGKNYISREPNP